jgi:hypothetical protein
VDWLGKFVGAKLRSQNEKGVRNIMETAKQGGTKRNRTIGDGLLFFNGKNE